MFFSLSSKLADYIYLLFEKKEIFLRGVSDAKILPENAISVSLEGRAMKQCFLYANKV